jgi:hypothetical protein
LANVLDVRQSCPTAVRTINAAKSVVVQFRLSPLSTSPISKLRAADDERRQAKRNSLADKLAVEAKTLADLKIEKAAVEGERRTVEADLGPVRWYGRADWQSLMS